MWVRAMEFVVDAVDFQPTSLGVSALLTALLFDNDVMNDDQFFSSPYNNDSAMDDLLSSPFAVHPAVCKFFMSGKLQPPQFSSEEFCWSYICLIVSFFHQFPIWSSG